MEIPLTQRRDAVAEMQRSCRSDCSPARLLLLFLTDISVIIDLHLGLGISFAHLFCFSESSSHELPSPLHYGRSG